MSSSDPLRAPRVQTPWLRLLAVTALALLIHGYHLGADDAAIYVPGIKQVANPGLYPFGAEFFQFHAHLSIFPSLVGGAARVTRLPVDLVIFAWYVAGTFLLMLAAWRLACVCFEPDSARWGGVVLLACVLTIPVAGTALVIADPYITARTLSTPATIFAIACYLSGRYKQAAAWSLLTALIHPQMGVYAAVFLGAMSLAARRQWANASLESAPAFACLAGIPFLFELHPAHGAARDALLSRTYFFVAHWTWYEWLGVFAPLALLAWFARAELRGARPELRTLARALPPFGLMFTGAALLLNASPRFENYTRLQPMRSLHIVYVVLFVLLGGLLGEYVLRRHLLRWLGLFGSLGAAMCLLQLSAFPASAHIEWPGAQAANSWTSAFLWIRDNTPQDAVFALDPSYMSLPGEDLHGFRAIAERSVLSDAVKDSGAVSLFPELAGEWEAEVQTLRGWKRFQLPDFRRVAARYPVSWFVIAIPAPAGLLCPYRNRLLSVCQLPALMSLVAPCPAHAPIIVASR